MTPPKIISTKANNWDYHLSFPTSPVHIIYIPVPLNPDNSNVDLLTSVTPSSSSQSFSPTREIFSLNVLLFLAIIPSLVHHVQWDSLIIRPLKPYQHLGIIIFFFLFCSFLCVRALNIGDKFLSSKLPKHVSIT